MVKACWNDLWSFATLQPNSCSSVSNPALQYASCLALHLHFQYPCLIFTFYSYIYSTSLPPNSPNSGNFTHRLRGSSLCKPASANKRCLKGPWAHQQLRHRSSTLPSQHTKGSSTQSGLQGLQEIDENHLEKSFGDDPDDFLQGNTPYRGLNMSSTFWPPLPAIPWASSTMILPSGSLGCATHEELSPG